MAVGIYVLHLHPGEEEIRRTFLREAAEYVDPVRCKKVQRLSQSRRGNAVAEDGSGSDRRYGEYRNPVSGRG